MHTHMDDHAWQQLLNKIYSVETECWNFLSFSRTFSDYDTGSSFSKFSIRDVTERPVSSLSPLSLLLSLYFK